MKNQTPTSGHGVPDAFLTKFGRHVTGILCGFDRLRFRGTLRMLFDPAVMEIYLLRCGVRIKNFKAFAQGLTDRVKAAAYQAAQAAGRPVRYLPRPDVAKEDLARQIARDDHVPSGLIAVLTAVEPCLSYSVRGDHQAKHIHLMLETRKCTHLYHHFLHPAFGLCHVRAQTWFPFTVDVCLNGREWLARQMQRAGLSFEQRENCFVRVSDAARAQALLDEQLRTDWPDQLNRLLAQAHPLHAELSRPLKQDYHWSASQTEAATDLLFRDARSLAALYPQFLHHGLKSFASPDVSRFLGKAQPNKFRGEVTSTLKRRPEGVRLRHTVNGNSIQVHDKQGSVLRVETTIVHPEHFTVCRPAASDPEEQLKWQRLRRGVADLWRRAEVSRSANGRHLEALASAIAPSIRGRRPTARCWKPSAGASSRSPAFATATCGCCCIAAK